MSPTNAHSLRTETSRFKVSEVGTIPAEWDVVKLESLCDGIMVGIASAATHAYRSKGVPMFRNQNIRPNRLDCSDILYIAPEYEITFRNKRLRGGDLLIARTGYPGTASLVPQAFSGAQSFTTLIARPTTTRVDPTYLCLFINSKAGQRYFGQIQIGGGQKNVNAEALKHTPIALPSTINEQAAIAEALSDADALIESLEQLIAKKRAIKQGAMQELLTGKRRLPGFNEEWEVKQLSEIGEALIGLTYAPSNIREHGVLVLRSSNISDGTLQFDNNVFVEADIPERIMVQPGDILICVRNGSRDLIGKCAMIDERCEGMTFGAFMAVFRTPYYRFIHHQFQSEILKKQIHEHLGATINQITNKSLNSFRVPLPKSEAEQLAIADALSDMAAEISLLEAKLSKARQVKQGMMQELLTGRVRLV